MWTAPKRLADDLCIDRAGALSVHYAPFEHVHEEAKLIIVGLTPGFTQAAEALGAARRALQNGASDADALRAAKETGAFAGTIRKNLIRLLEAAGVEAACGFSAQQLFGGARHYIHTTSAVRYPVFKRGENYNGSVIETPLLRQCVERFLGAELNQTTAPVIALGKHSGAALRFLVGSGSLPAARYLGELPHPSGQNGGPIREALTAAPSTSKYAHAMAQIRERLRAARSPATA